jgi:hypothetical protein
MFIKVYSLFYVCENEKKSAIVAVIVAQVLTQVTWADGQLGAKCLLRN